MKNLVSKTIQISTAQKCINRKPRNDKDRCDPVDPQFRFLFRKHLIIKLKQNKRYLNSSNFFENTNFHNQQIRHEKQNWETTGNDIRRSELFQFSPKHRFLFTNLNVSELEYIFQFSRKHSFHKFTNFHRDTERITGKPRNEKKHSLMKQELEYSFENTINRYIWRNERNDKNDIRRPTIKQSSIPILSKTVNFHDRQRGKI